MTRLVLGTAQLGMPYGIANVTGQPDPVRATEIVSAAWSAGIRYFDTAQAYGASETVLGVALRELGVADAARVITKLSPNVDTGDADEILINLRASCERLGLQRLWAVLLHREEQLDQWNETIGVAFERARQEGLIEHAGVSVYSPQRALQALELDGLDALQAPANVFDRRMKRAGVFDHAATRGVIVFIRSVYLQGLALLPVARVVEVAPFAVAAVAALENFCYTQRLDRREFTMRYALALHPDALLVVGAETPAQVADNAAQAAPLPATVCAAWDAEWPVDEEILINPSRWPARKAA